MKAVLISIAPEWCSQIVLGDKTMEVRKTRPRLKTPFKVYIYCSKAKNKIGWVRMCPRGGWQRLDGSVIGEFTCDEIRRVHIPQPAYQDKLDTVFTSESRMSYSALHNYCPEGDAYFWHISDLKIYDRPRKLIDFLPNCRFGEDGECEYRRVYCEHQNYDYNPDGSVNVVRCDKRVQGAPQSWCYVEDAECTS